MKIWNRLGGLLIALGVTASAVAQMGRGVVAVRENASQVVVSYQMK